jgi:hypothetical protein
LAPISELPVELLLKITDQLPMVSQVCLALSCKPFLELLGGPKVILDRSELHHPLHPVRPFRTPWRLDAFETPRWKLLRCLEDSRWRLCSGCLELHPVSEFSSSELAKHTEERTCMFGTSVGLVYLCPCISMTFRDKLKLVERLDGTLTSEDYSRELATRNPNLSLGHECVYNYKTMEVHTELTPFLDSNGELVIRTKYHVTCSHLPLSITPYLPRLCCPHRSIYTHAMDFCEAFSGFGVSSIPYDEHERSKFCPHCATSFCNFISTRDWDGDDHFSFQTVRRLGKPKSMADETWHNQVHYSYDKHLDVMDKRCRSPWRSYFAPC